MVWGYSPIGDSRLSRLELEFLEGDTLIQVVVLRKIFSTMPQQFMLVLKDSMKVQNTAFGAEREIRCKLQAGGISQPDIDKLFDEANCAPNPQSTI
ncbi:MAG: hypothetical protein WAK48_02280 [Candidatus Acidiferrum sp.]